MEPLERIFQFEDFTLDLRRGCLRGPEGEIELRPKSFDVLRHLVENAGRLVPKDEIIGAVWRNLVVSDESLARCISDVRLALGDRRQRIIKTMPRRGYLFAAETGVKSASRAAVEPGVPASSPPALDPPSEALEVQVPGSRSAVDRATSAALLDQQQLAERRQLTVMACEFAGLAALSGLDPEELQTAVAAYRQRCADIIGQHHGYVAHDLEDGFHAYFGYPKASEYDAEHAVRAGLALLRSAEAPTVSWPAPQPRIGLASGLVVITGESGIGNRGIATAVGETPLVAKHLQMAAVAGSLVIDQTTRQLVAGLFEYRDLGGVARDGHPGVVPAWRVTGASSADNRFEARRIPDAADSQAQSGADAPATTAPSAVAPQTSLSPFVGRARELEILEGCLDEAGNDIRAIDIVGEPGIGKSRLLHEFRRHLSGSKVRVWLGNCWPGDEQMPFRPFIEVVRRSFRLAPDDPEVEIAGKIEARLALVGLATPENLGLLLNLLGLKPPANSLRGLDDVLVGLRTRDLLLQLVREGSRAAPVVVLLEDLHWIDNASQDLLARLIGGPSVGAVAFVHTRRPDYTPPWADRQNTTELVLKPLTASETSQVVRARLGVSELTGALGRLITDRAEGNPLFAEELANFLIEGGIVRRREAGLEYEAAAVAAAMPPSVQSLLSSRVDRLIPSDRALLQAAAVIGRRFAPDLLGTVTGRGAAERRLGAMQSLDLIRHDGAADEFVFKHALVRDALYASLLSSQRQALHLKIATEIEHRNAARLGEVAEILAHHYSRADHREKAIEYLTLVGRKAIRIYSLEEGKHSLRTALAMARIEAGKTIDERTAKIMVDLAVVYYMQYRAADTIALIGPELDRIAALGDTVEAAILLDIYGVALFTACRFREADRMAHRALAIADRLGDRRSQAHARCGVIMMAAYVDPPSLADFEAFAQRAYAEAEEGEDTYTVVRMTLNVATNYMHRGLVREGRQYAFRLMRFGREREDRRAQGMALMLLGWFDILAEDFTAALGHGKECVATAHAPYDQQWGRHVIGVSLLLLGRIAEGAAMMREHRQHALANGWNYAALAAEAPLGVSLLLRGKLRKGVRAFELLISRCESEYDYPGYADWTRVFLAEFYVALLTKARKPPVRVVVENLLFLAVAKCGAARKAEALLRQAAQNRQYSERGVFRARIDYNLGLIQQVSGKTHLARSHFERARAIAIAQEAPAIIAKIDAALKSLSQV